MDDDPTPPFRPKQRGQTQADRDLASERARRERTHAPIHGVPIDPVADLELALGHVEQHEENTSPVDLYLRELSEKEREIVAALGLDPDSPTPLREWLKLSERVNENRSEMRRAKRDSGNTALAELAKLNRQPIEQMSHLERSVRRFWAALSAVAGVAVVALGIAAKYLTDQATLSERERNERQLLIEHDRDHEQRLRALEYSRGRRFEPDRAGHLQLDSTPLVKEPTP